MKKETPMYSEAYIYAQVSNIRPFNSHGRKHTHLHENSTLSPNSGKHK